MSNLFNLLSAMCGKIKKPDLSQNDPEAADYVKGRTHYYEKQTAEIFSAEFTAEVGPPAEITTDYTFTAETAFPTGAIYTVNFDGTDYECIADNGLIGNFALMGEPVDTGEPFLMVAAGPNTVLVGTRDAGNHTVTVSGLVNVAVELPREFIASYLSGLEPIVLEKVTTEEELEKARIALSTYRYSSDGYSTNPVFWDGVRIEEILHQDGNWYYREPYQMVYKKTTNNGDGTIDKDSYYTDNIPFELGSSEQLTVPSGKVFIKRHGRYSSGSYKLYEDETAISTEEVAPGVYPSFKVYWDGTIEGRQLILHSSTEGSTKKFKITVDDSGTLSATEVTA